MWGSLNDFLKDCQAEIRAGLNEEGSIVIFRYNGDSQDVVIPRGVTRLGDEAFAGKNIKSVYIPYTVSEIGYGCFCNCKQLERIIFQDIYSLGGMDWIAFGGI